MIETIIPQVTQFWKVVVPLAVVNIGGWLKNSIADGEIQSYELKQLGVTTIRVLVLAVVAFYGWNGLPMENIDTMSAGFLGVLANMFLPKTKIKK